MQHNTMCPMAASQKCTLCFTHQSVSSSYTSRNIALWQIIIQHCVTACLSNTINSYTFYEQSVRKGTKGSAQWNTMSMHGLLQPRFTNTCTIIQINALEDPSPLKAIPNVKGYISFLCPATNLCNLSCLLKACSRLPLWMSWILEPATSCVDSVIWFSLPLAVSSTTCPPQRSRGVWLPGNLPQPAFITLVPASRKKAGQENVL